MPGQGPRPSGHASRWKNTRLSYLWTLHTPSRRRLKKFPKVVEKLAKKRSYDHIFAHACRAAWTSINFSENTRRRRRGATPNHRRARRCASPKNIILDFLAPNSSFGDYNNMGGKVLVYKKSVMEVALEWVRAAVRRADECVKAL